jgi:hypothetical protein
MAQLIKELLQRVDALERRVEKIERRETPSTGPFYALRL